MVLMEQIAALIDYLESQPELAFGTCSRAMEGRSLAKRLWEECAVILNSVSTDCPVKTPAEWRAFYNEYKCKLLKKVKLQKQTLTPAGCGPAKPSLLTPLQERLHHILGTEFEYSITPLKKNSSRDDSSQQDCNITRNENNIPIEENGSTLHTVLPTKSQERVTCHSGFHKDEDKDNATTIDSSNVEVKVEPIAPINSNDISEHAQAMNNLAKSIDRLGGNVERAADKLGRLLENFGDMIGLLVAPAAKKRRIHKEDPPVDTESD